MFVGSTLTGCATSGYTGHAEGEIPAGYNTEIPPAIMTPDRVKTRIGGSYEWLRDNGEGGR